MSEKREESQHVEAFKHYNSTSIAKISVTAIALRNVCIRIKQSIELIHNTVDRRRV